jgi:hypothetical protein
MVASPREERSELIDFQGVRHAPENEMGVVLLFAKLHRMLGFPVVDVIQPHFPDCWAIQKIGNGTRRVWIEFEYASRGFKSHVRQLRGLRPRRGIVICWHHDWRECERYATVIELRRHIAAGCRVWLQSTLPEYQRGLDEAPFKRKGTWNWSVPSRARPGDLLLMWRAGTRAQARKHDVDVELLQSLANIYEVTSIPKPDRRWGTTANVWQVVLLDEPLRWGAIRSDAVLHSAPWVRASMQGRPEVTPYWWRIYELLVQLNPRLKKHKSFQRFKPEGL